MSRLGLRARLTLSFGALFLVLSTFLAFLTFEVTRTYLLHQRESAAVRQTVADSRTVAAGVRAADADIPTLLDSLGTRSGAEALIYVDGRAFSSAPTVDPSNIPPSLLAHASSDTEAYRQRFVLNGTPRLAVGGQIGTGLSYIEVFSLAELHHSLEVFSLVLVAGAVGLTFVGTGLGFFVSQRVLNPVTSFATAAANLAEGAFDTRMTGGQDRDLASLAATFNMMATALQTRVRRDAAFAGDVSHELRTPLTAIVTAASVMEAEQEQLSSRGKRAMRLISAELTRLERLVNDLIEIARADSGSPLDLEQVDLVTLTRHAIDRSAFAVKVHDLATASTLIAADKLRLERVLLNLLENAERHANGAVGVNIRSAPGVVRLEVDDAGPGIEAKDKRAIFQRFHRGSSKPGTAGSGIGLALVEEHVQLHGGRIWVQDREPHGSRFVIEFPGLEHE